VGGGQVDDFDQCADDSADRQLAKSREWFALDTGLVDRTSPDAQGGSALAPSI
jgi:hypothetical protein